MERKKIITIGIGVVMVLIASVLAAYEIGYRQSTADITKITAPKIREVTNMTVIGTVEKISGLEITVKALSPFSSERVITANQTTVFERLVQKNPTGYSQEQAAFSDIHIGSVISAVAGKSVPIGQTFVAEKISILPVSKPPSL